MDNTCEWLSFNSVKYCGKACYIRYCKIHLIMLRKGDMLYHPCMICSKGLPTGLIVCEPCVNKLDRL